jgi:hypothetical protein
MLSGPPARDALAVARRLTATQAQDPRGARLAIRARSAGLSAAAVDAALDERALLVTWLNRGTLHLVASEDYAWLHALTAPPLETGIERRLRQEGVSAAAAGRGVRAIERALAEHGPLARERLRELLAAAGIRVAGQALVHQLALASLRGLIVRGPMAGGQQAFVLARDWLGELARVPASYTRERALAELARRYLAGHAPAEARDLARWAGLPLRDARSGLAAIASSLHERDDGLLELRRDPARARGLPPPRLLGAFEPVLLGWCSREQVLAGHESRVVSGGLFRPFAMAAGRAVATWRVRDGRVELSPFAQLDEEVARQLAADAEEVLRFLGLPASVASGLG